jgi:hypothetical protein
MNHQEPTQLSLFSNKWPQWKSLPSHAQKSIVDGLARMLLQRLQQQSDYHRDTTSTTGES